MNKPRSMSHMPQLDGLRALAVSGVLISHFGLGVKLDWLANALPWGHLGVRLFFVLSGFLITGILIERRFAIQAGLQSSSNALSHFYGRRFLRIFPVFYLAIIAAYIFNVGHMHEVAIWHVFYLSNLESVIYNGLSGSQHFLRDPTSAHFWSLAVEEQFYLIWPALILFTKEDLLIKVIIAIAVVAPAWRIGWFLYDPVEASHSLFACLDSLGVGGMLAIYVKGDNKKLAWIRDNIKPLLIFGSTILIAACLAHAAGVLHRPKLVLIDIGESIVFAFIVARAAQGRRDLFGKFLQWNVLRYIGKISYGIYVYHAFMSPLRQWIWKEYALPDITQSALNPLILTIMTVIAATLSWHFFEKPLNRFKRYMPRGPVAENPKKSESLQLAEETV